MDNSGRYRDGSDRRLMSSASTMYRLFLVPALFIIYSAFAIAQDDPLYDEISVYVKLPYIGMGEIDALIRDENVYLSVTSFFDFIKIRNVPNDNLDVIEGFWINPDNLYSIDRPGNRIMYDGRTWPLGEGDLVRSDNGLFLALPWFGKVFGLDCRFAFRDLTVTVDTKQELPGIRELKLEEMRANMTRLKGEISVDTVVERTYPAFRFGMADWSVYAIEQPGGISQARLNLALGAVIAGGEATASLNYYSGDPFNEKLQYYLWRHVNNDRPFLRQIMAGKINTQATASIYDPVIGIQITNTPTSFRRSFGSYTLTDKTEPGWTVELYVNNVLVDYVKADASGFFTFEVPLVYGNTSVKLKFYGPWGEERTREQNLTIPYNFIPHREIEYTLSAGVVEDSVWSRFSRAGVSYGATRFLTIGGGAEYLSSVSSTPVMPFVNASLRLPGNVLLNGEYTHGVRTRGRLSYRFPANIQFDLDYILYDKDQKAIRYNYLEERRASLSVPLRIKNFSAYSRMSYYNIVLPLANYTTAEWMLAGSVMGINTNLTTYGLFVRNADPGIHSQLSLAIRLPGEFLIMPQTQYSYTEGEFMTARLGLEKRVLQKGYINLSVERNFRHNITMGEVGVRYDFSFAQTGVSARQTNRQATFVQYARGSLINDRPTGWLKADNRTNVGRGGISVVAFLDLNANGRFDAGEQKVPGLNIRSSAGTLERSENDTTIHITGLEPYAKYYIEVDESGFENISWRLGKKSYAVISDPNMLKLIEIPVYVRGEATGTVMLTDRGVTKGIGRVIVNIIDSADNITGRALTEEDGYFSWFGLAPGKYMVRIDSSQLRRLNLLSDPDSIEIMIGGNVEGDYVEGLDFILRKPDLVAETIILPDSVIAEEIPEIPGTVTGTDTLRIVPPEPGRTVARDTSYLVIHEVTRELVTITEDYYAVQFGAFRNKLYAEIMKKKVEGVLDKKVELFEEDGFWKVRITGFKDREDLEKYIPIIHSQGITEIWVISNKAVRGEWITQTREDSLAMVKETVKEPPMPVVIRGTTVQLGAFSTLEETVSMSDRLLAAAEKLVTIRNEGGLFKVQLTGFADTNEVREFIPLLQKHGFDDITVLHESETGLLPVVPAAITPADGQPAEPGLAEELPITVEQPVIAVEEPEPAEEIAPPPPPQPRFVLHAGSYYRKAEAERAKQRIERKLNLPVEIIEQWDSYRVIITGFFTREETYPFYPELAGLGFTDIFVYEKPLTER